MKDWEYEGIQVYCAYSSKNGKFYGQVGCRPERTLRNGRFVNSLYVEDLFSEAPGSGAGSCLMRFARRLSEKLGCEGRLHLMASSVIEPERVPHPFYYKIGMNTGKEEIDKKLAKFAKSGKNATSDDFKTMMMYYPPIEYKKPKTILEYLAKFALHMVQQTVDMNLKLTMR
jgi:hypothetical protein